PRDAHIDAAVERRALRTGQQIEYPIAIEHFVRMAREDREQVELARRQRDGITTVARQAMRTEIELEVAEAHDRRRRALGGRARARASQHRANAREQLAWVERLADVIVRADFEADDPIDVFSLRRHHDDRDVDATLEALRDRETVFARQ